MEQTKDFILTGLMNIWLDCITIIIALTIMFFLDVKLTFAAIFIFPFYILTVYFFFGRLRKLTRVRSQALAEVQGFYMNAFKVCQLLKALLLKIMKLKILIIEIKTFTKASNIQDGTHIHLQR